MPEHKIIAFANQKGGVGKTTSAVNIASSLAAKKYSVLLVDCDPQGNATSGLGIRKKSSSGSVYDVIIGRSKTADMVCSTTVKNLSVLPSSMDLVGAEIELIDMADREARLRAALEQVRDSYDFIIIDCPPSLGLLTLNCLTAADGVVIPLLCEFYSLEGISQLTQTIRHVKSRVNPSLELIGVLVNMYDGRLTLTVQVMEEIKRYFGAKLFARPVPRNVKLSEAPSYGVPIDIYDKYSKGARAYEEVTEELIRRCGGKA
ncbi:MAG: AAA family ATPase [Eubacteriales bacterium]|jgi:virC1 protein|nr:AAA family ATPase [Ruminococcus sp.]MDY2742660.1 AAA family ATPase [Eubacteriales bacterium]